MADSRHAEAQLALAMSRSMQRIVQGNNQRSTQLASQVVQHGVATGFVAVAGAGESTAEISFPNVFVEKPVFSFGFELGPTSWINQGNFPVGTAVVTGWVEKQLNDMTTWVGANVAIVLTGVQGPFVFHYDFKGRALAMPTGAT